MSYIMIDVETDGPIPGDYSLISIGAIVVEPSLKKNFYAQVKPISEKYLLEALKVSNFTREQTLKFEEPKKVFLRFKKWIEETSKGRPILISDNNGFDAMFISWYFHHFLEENPFGHSSQNLGSFYKGIVRDVSQSFKHLRKTEHTHNALDDAKGNAEALLILKEKYNLKINLE